MRVRKVLLEAKDVTFLPKHKHCLYGCPARTPAPLALSKISRSICSGAICVLVFSPAFFKGTGHLYYVYVAAAPAAVLEPRIAGKIKGLRGLECLYSPYRKSAEWAMWPYRFISGKSSVFCCEFRLFGGNSLRSCVGFVSWLQIIPYWRYFPSTNWKKREKIHECGKCLKRSFFFLCGCYCCCWCCQTEVPEILILRVREAFCLLCNLTTHTSAAPFYLVYFLQASSPARVCVCVCASESKSKVASVCATLSFSVSHACPCFLCFLCLLLLPRLLTFLWQLLWREKLSTKSAKQSCIGKNMQAATSTRTHTHVRQKHQTHTHAHAAEIAAKWKHQQQQIQKHPARDVKTGEKYCNYCRSGCIRLLDPAEGDRLRSLCMRIECQLPKFANARDLHKHN